MTSTLAQQISSKPASNAARSTNVNSGKTDDLRSCLVRAGAWWTRMKTATNNDGRYKEELNSRRAVKSAETWGSGNFAFDHEHIKDGAMFQDLLHIRKAPTPPDESIFALAKQARCKRRPFSCKSRIDTSVKTESTKDSLVKTEQRARGKVYHGLYLNREPLYKEISGLPLLRKTRKLDVRNTNRRMYNGLLLMTESLNIRQSKLQDRVQKEIGFFSTSCTNVASTAERVHRNGTFSERLRGPKTKDVRSSGSLECEICEDHCIKGQGPPIRCLKEQASLRPNEPNRRTDHFEELRHVPATQKGTSLQHKKSPDVEERLSVAKSANGTLSAEFHGNHYDGFGKQLVESRLNHNSSVSQISNLQECSECHSQRCSYTTILSKTTFRKQDYDQWSRQRTLKT